MSATDSFRGQQNCFRDQICSFWRHFHKYEPIDTKQICRKGHSGLICSGDVQSTQGASWPKQILFCGPDSHLLYTACLRIILLSISAVCASKLFISSTLTRPNIYQQPAAHRVRCRRNTSPAGQRLLSATCGFTEQLSQPRAQYLVHRIASMHYLLSVRVLACPVEFGCNGAYKIINLTVREGVVQLFSTQLNLTVHRLQCINYANCYVTLYFSPMPMLSDNIFF